MKTVIKVLTIIFLSLFLATSLIAQCTDNDDDGYYYEEDCGTPRDCNDADPDIYPGATEICDGYDNDCDNNFDEGCDTSCDSPEKWGEEMRVSDAPDNSTESSLVWTGSEYGVCWNDFRFGNSDIYFASFDSSGNKIVSDIRISDHVNYDSGLPSLVWTGSEYGVAWFNPWEGDEIYFARFDSSGIKIGSDKRITYDPAFSAVPSLVWNGNGYGISWHDARDNGGLMDTYFTRLDPSGNKIGSDIRVTDTSGSFTGFPVIAWNGDGYGISWQDGRHAYTLEIYFTRLDPSGKEIGSDIRVTNYSSASEYPSLVWTGSEYGISWDDDRDGNREIYFARLNSSGGKIGSDVRVTKDSLDSYLTSIKWTGNEYGISWNDDRDGNYEVYFARLSSLGSKIGSDVRVSFYSGDSGDPSLAWKGSEYGITWQDERTEAWEIYFAPIKCCDNDVDMDTFGACDDCDDSDNTVYPGAEELCDLKDNDCDGTIDEGFPTPGATTDLIFDNDKATMDWNSVWTADRYDVMKGNLMALRATDGDFTSSLTDCLEDDSLDTQSFDSDEPSSPGDGYYYVVRAQADCKNGTCNCGHPKQVGDRDTEIEASADKCP